VVCPGWSSVDAAGATAAQGYERNPEAVSLFTAFAKLRSPAALGRRQAACPLDSDGSHDCGGTAVTSNIGAASSVTRLVSPRGRRGTGVGAALFAVGVATLLTGFAGQAGDAVGPNTRRATEKPRDRRPS
jgi:hypothetical protein